MRVFRRALTAIAATGISVGFTQCGTAETDFGAAPRMVLALS